MRWFRDEALAKPEWAAAKHPGGGLQVTIMLPLAS
jgi:hypothetical protein